MGDLQPARIGITPCGECGSEFQWHYEGCARGKSATSPGMTRHLLEAAVVEAAKALRKIERAITPPHWHKEFNAAVDALIAFEETQNSNVQT